MKFRTLFPVLMVLSCFQFATAQDVPMTQMPIFTKVTASWCPNCGTWGWELMEGVVEDNVGDAIVLNAHFSGDLFNAAGADLKSNLGANGQPKFYINNTDLGATSSTHVAKRTEAEQMIAANLALTPSANAGVKYTRTGNTLSIDTKTIFFEEMTGKFHLSILVLENNVSNNQQPIGVQNHPSVVRAAESGNTFGDAIAEGTIAANTEITGSYTIDGSASWDYNNVTIAALLWSEENGTYTYINGTKASESMVSGLNQIATNFQAEWRSNDGQHQLFLNNDESLENVAISLISTHGQELQNLFSGKLPSGVNMIPLETGDWSAGNYFVKIETPTGIKTVAIQL